MSDVLNAGLRLVKGKKANPEMHKSVKDRITGLFSVELEHLNEGLV